MNKEREWLFHSKFVEAPSHYPYQQAATAGVASEKLTMISLREPKSHDQTQQ